WADNTGASLLLGAIMEEATGRDLVDYADEVLFRPIGIEHVAWSKGSGGYYDTGGGLRLKPQEMARLGYLMLRDGQWQGRQVVPAAWVSRSTAAHVQANDLYDYGYQWWVQPDGQGFEAQGLYGQQVSVFTAADMVVTITAVTEEGTLFHVGGFVHDFILAACSDLPPRPAIGQYQDHGVTFVYPGDFSLSEQPFPGREAVSNEAGIVQITSTGGFLETFSLLWSETASDEDERALLDQYLAYIADSEESFAPGDYGQGIKDGRPMSYRFFTLGAGETTVQAMSGLWICDESGRLFGATYLSAAAPSADALLASFDSLVAGVSCP
ncbi:MAG: serine hydrolase, partial [Chloroflexota bacterium]